MAGKSSAVADVAAQAGPDQGRSVAHTPAREDDGAGDLFGFEAELALFDDDTIRPPKRGPGRPPGSVNRTTLQLTKLMRAKGYRDPYEFLASIYSMPTSELARALSEPAAGDEEPVKVNRQAAADLQVKAAVAALPYAHQKMPIAIQHSGDGQRPVIIIHDGPAATTPGRVIEGETMSAHEAQDIEQYQGLSDGAPAGSHASPSHDGANDE